MLLRWWAQPLAAQQRRERPMPRSPPPRASCSSSDYEPTAVLDRATALGRRQVNGAGLLLLQSLLWPEAAARAGEQPADADGDSDDAQDFFSRWPYAGKPTHRPT